MADTTITSNGNFTAATGKYEGLVELWGPGGNGADGSDDLNGGGGGGGGAYSAALVVFVPGVSKAVTVNAGADATFDTTVVVAKKGANASGGTGGAGGLASGGTGTTKRDGGTGGNGAAGVDAGGGGGGGSATSAAAGTNGAAGSGSSGGGGGGGQGSGGDGGEGGAAGAEAVAGVAPGGGGGGGGDEKTGAAGAAGQCAVTYTGYTYANTSAGFLGFVNVPLAASTTLSDIVAAPASGLAIVITGWDLRVTGAAAPLAFTSGGSTIAQDRVPLAGNWKSAPEASLRLAAATSLNLLGGASSTRVNGHLNYRVVAV